MRTDTINQVTELVRVRMNLQNLIGGDRFTLCISWTLINPNVKCYHNGYFYRKMRKSNKQSTSLNFA